MSKDQFEVSIDTKKIKAADAGKHVLKITLEDDLKYRAEKVQMDFTIDITYESSDVEYGEG